MNSQIAQSLSIHTPMCKKISFQRRYLSLEKQSSEWPPPKQLCTRDNFGQGEVHVCLYLCVLSLSVMSHSFLPHGL